MIFVGILVGFVMESEEPHDFQIPENESLLCATLFRLDLTYYAQMLSLLVNELLIRPWRILRAIRVMIIFSRPYKYRFQ